VRAQDDIVVPEMLAELFSSKVRAAVLALLLPRPHIGFSLTELSRRLGLPLSSLQHECYKLTRLGLLRDERIGNARRYRPDPTFPLLDPMTTLTLCALPLPIALQGAAEQVPGLEDAWVAGDLDTADPIYLVVLGDLELEAIDGVFERARKALMPTVGPNRIELAYYRTGDWRERRNAGDPFVAALEQDRRLDLVPATITCAEAGASQA
jgi:DNA-binding transcriptional ArsR family regulator